MIEPTFHDIGRPVRYQSLGGDKVEVGIIGKITDEFIFVRYAGSMQLVATSRSVLEWLDKRPGNPAGPHGQMENLARSIATEILSETTMQKGAIAAEVDRSWLSYVLLIEEDTLADAVDHDAKADSISS